MADKPTSEKPPEPTFESAMERLESIVEDMESDKMPLQELIVRYEEGTKLVQVCQEKLADAEKRIETITRNAAGKPLVAEFEPAAAAPAPAKPPSTPDPDVRLF